VSTRTRELLDWARDTLGAPIESYQPHPASGRSRLIWVLRPAGRPAALLRSETGLGPFAGTEFTLAREAGLVRALAGSSVPVPTVHAVTPDGATVLMELLPGTADLGGAGPETDAVLTRYAHALALLHHHDPATVGLPRPATAADHALLDLDTHRRSYQRCPATRTADEVLGWLTTHVPCAPTRTSLLHGDAGPGNFLHHNGQLTGLIDWEMAHLGDPMDDLAWLWFRTCLLGAGGPAALTTLLRAYARASGFPLDPRRIDYYCLAVLARCLIATLVRHRNNPAHPTEPVERMSRLVGIALDNQHRTGRTTGGPLTPLPDLTPLR
jgi:aminoglycoside phosphotransferase (APT) family kinase protein